MNKNVNLSPWSKAALLTIASLFSGCSSITSTSTDPFEDGSGIYAWKLLYSHAPEFRKAKLELYATSRDSNHKPDEAILFTARWRYAIDKTKFIQLFKIAEPGKPVKVSISTGLEDETHVIQESPYATKSNSDA